MKRVVSAIRVRKATKIYHQKKLSKNIELLQLARLSEKQAKEIKSRNITKELVIAAKKVEEEYQQSSTAQNLDLLRNISSCVTETRKVRGQVRDYQLASRAPDLVKTEALQAKLKLVEALVHDLEASIASQKILTERLQQPFKEQHFKLEAQYHENAMSMFENISSSLSDCHENIELLKWHKRHSLDEVDKVSDSLKELSFKARNLQQKASQIIQT